MQSKVFERIFLIVQLATVAVFLGRAWQHLFWDAPFRTLLWDENWMKAIVEALTNMKWEAYITSLETDDRIQGLIKLFGWFYLICAIVAISIRRIPKVFGKILLLGSVGLIFLAGLYCKEKFSTFGQFFEYTIQFTTPIFLYVLAFKKPPLDKIIFWMKIAIVLSFTCHGLYALNYYPRPGNFVEMTINTIGLSEQNAYYFLYLVGIMDFIISVLLFIPGKIRIVALLYAVFWGFMTTIARVWANFHFEFIGTSLHQWLHESVMRIPHFLIPLAVLIYYWKKDNSPEQKMEKSVYSEK